MGRVSVFTVKGIPLYSFSWKPRLSGSKPFPDHLQTKTHPGWHVIETALCPSQSDPSILVYYTHPYALTQWVDF